MPENSNHRVIRDIEYVNRNGAGLALDLHLPPGGANHPVVVKIPGGGWFECNKIYVPRFLLDHGFAVACINYRVSGEAIAPANIRDCMAAVRWVRRHAGQYQLDPGRIGAYGKSAGGHLAALLGAATGVAGLDEDAGDPDAVPATVRAVCDICGPTDLNRMAIPEVAAQFAQLRKVTDQYLGGPVTQRHALARLVSPMTYVSAGYPPALLIHGDQDPVVPVEESILFHQALQKAGANSRLLVVKGGKHSNLDEPSEDIITRFFVDHLRNAAG